jgi:hypothetical protein
MVLNPPNYEPNEFLFFISLSSHRNMRWTMTSVKGSDGYEGLGQVVQCPEEGLLRDAGNMSFEQTGWASTRLQLN